MKFKKIISAFIAAGLLLSGSAFAAENAGSVTGDQDKSIENTDNTAKSTPMPISDELLVYKNILTFIENAYIDDSVNKDQLMADGISNLLKDNPDMLAKLFKATFESLDMYSDYYTQEEFEKYMNGINSSAYGVGLVMVSGGDYIEVNEVIQGGPAEKAGIKAGDLITAVDGKDVKGLNMDEIRSMVVGDHMTTVAITVKRGEQELTYTVVRDSTINYSTVSGAVLKDGIGYVRISNFAENTASEFSEIAEKLKNDGINKLILDLRDNPGGYMISAVQIASELIPKGKIIEVKFRQEENNTVYNSYLEKSPFNICVLANAKTASAAEILTSSIVESGAGILVGDTTYGKALVQDMFRMPYGQAMKMTTGEYITRNGNKINGVGIEPTVFILNGQKPVDASKYTAFEYSGTYSVGDSGNDVKAAEERLAGMGYNVGDVDDNYTERTAAAVAEFQTDAGLFPYGVLDHTT
ncbi:MAG: PDZ domain-containing protein, partial [Oscillospiraceae bacterium]|nr:PDZ domain-containing protein [Oscillospiraceae bacterium]